MCVISLYYIVCIIICNVCLGNYDMHVCVYSYVCMYFGVPLCVCTCGVRVWVHIGCIMCVCVCVDSPSFLCVRLCAKVMRTSSWDPDQLQETQTRSGFIFTVDPIHRRFKDRPMGWFGDSYRFVQWRPDDDSLPKSRHFMWVFVLVLFSNLPCHWIFVFYFYHFICCYLSLLTLDYLWI